MKCSPVKVSSFKMEESEKEKNLNYQKDNVDGESSVLKNNGSGQNEEDKENSNSSEKSERYGLLQQSCAKLTTRQGLLQLSSAKLGFQDKGVEAEVGPLTVLNTNKDENVEIRADSQSEVDSNKFFSREWKAFKDEMGTKLSDKEHRNTVLNFGEMAKEVKRRK